MTARLALTLGEIEARVDLFPERAPHTVRALLDLLPIDGPAVHGRWSGQVFWIKRPLPDLPEENAVHLLRPGSLVVLPGAGEIMVAIGEAAVHNALGLPRTANWIGRVTAGLDSLCAAGRDLQLAGRRPIRFAPARGARRNPILVELDGVACRAELAASETANAFHAILTWGGMAVHDCWSGHVLYAIPPCPLPPGPADAEGTAAEATAANLFGGEIAYYPPWQRVLLGYDFGQFRTGASQARSVRRLGRLDEADPAFAELAARARAMQAYGQRRLSIHGG